MRRLLEFTHANWHRELHLGAYAGWKDPRVNGLELGLKLGFWSLGVKLFPERTLADRMVETLKKL